jgi:hypothetical protein
MEILDGAVSIFVSIAGKVFRFVISNLAGAIRTFVGFLKSALGIDITGFLDWLGFIFDTGKLLETQAASHIYSVAFFLSLSIFFSFLLSFMRRLIS